MKIDLWIRNEEISFTRLSTGQITLNIGDTEIYMTRLQAEEIIQTLRVALTDEAAMERECGSRESRA